MVLGMGDAMPGASTPGTSSTGMHMSLNADSM